MPLILPKLLYGMTLLSTIGVFLFYANKGHYPKIQLQVENDAQITKVDSFVIDLKVVHNNLKRAIKDAQH